MLNHDSFLNHVVVNNLIGNYEEHAHYPSNVAHVIVSTADLLMLIQPQRLLRDSETDTTRY